MAGRGIVIVTGDGRGMRKVGLAGPSGRSELRPGCGVGRSVGGHDPGYRRAGARSASRRGECQKLGAACLGLTQHSRCEAQSSAGCLAGSSLYAHVARDRDGQTRLSWL